MIHIQSRTSNSSCPNLQYQASFHTHSAARGPRKKIYHGHLDGKGPRKGEDAVVKVFRDSAGTEEHCDLEIEKHNLARKLAARFNKLLADDRSKVTFTLPMKSRVESLGMGTFFCRHKGRAIDKQEWVLMEENLVTQGEYQVFIRKTGERLTNDPCSLDAFLHFAYHESQGTFVMCGFQGIHNKDGYLLTTPCFHSTDQSFGCTVDRGMAGIQEVFLHHQCNNLCYHLLSKPAMDPMTNGVQKSHEDKDVVKDDEDSDDSSTCEHHQTPQKHTMFRTKKIVDVSNIGKEEEENGFVNNGVDDKVNDLANGSVKGKVNPGVSIKINDVAVSDDIPVKHEKVEKEKDKKKHGKESKKHCDKGKKKTHRANVFAIGTLLKKRPSI